MRSAAVFELDAEDLVGHRDLAGGVGADEVADHEDDRRGPDVHAAARIAGNDVAGTRGDAANILAAGRVDQHAETAVGNGGGARGVQPDVIALDHVGRRRLGNIHAVAAVARDDVASAGRRAADRAGVVPSQEDALVGIADLGDAVGAEADEVALDGGGAAAVDEDAGGAVARDDVAGACCRAADGRRTARHPDAVGRVGPRRGPASTGHADEVPLDNAGAGPGGDHDAVSKVAANDVARRDSRAADDRAGARVHELDPRDAIAEHLEAVRRQADGVARDDAIVGGDAAAEADDHAAERRVPRGVIGRDDVARDRGVVGAVEQDTRQLVGQGEQAVGADAYEVAQDLVGPRIEDIHTVRGVAGDDVALRGRCAANDVQIVSQEDALVAVAQRAAAEPVGADEVIDNGIAEPLQQDARAGVAGDQVAVGEGRGANDVAA